MIATLGGCAADTITATTTTTAGTGANAEFTNAAAVGRSSSAAENEPSSSELRIGERDSRPAALMNGQAINWSELQALLAETAGAAVLEEVLLDRLLRMRLDRERIEISRSDLEREQRLLLESLDPEPNRAVLLLDELRQKRALGERRFALLLSRNAMLRAIVNGDVTVNEAELRAEYDLSYGPRVQVRLFTAAERAAAGEAWRRISAGEPFGDVAVQESTDLSASRGGLLEPISPLDPRYPESIRRVLDDLQPDELSPVVPIETGFAFVQLVRRLPASDVSFERVRPQLEETARLGRERFLMESLARELIGTTDLVILDPALKSSWERAQRQ